MLHKKTGEARPMVRKALKIAEELENLFSVFLVHHMLGDCAWIDGKYLESESEYGMGVKTILKYGDTSYTCIDMLGFAMSIAGQGRYAKALRLNAAATKTALIYGFIVPEEIPIEFWHELVMQHIVGTRKTLGEELTNKYEEEGCALSFDEAVKYALNFKID